MKRILLVLIGGWLCGCAFAAQEVVDGVTWSYQIRGTQATIQGEARYRCSEASSGAVVQREPSLTPLKTCCRCGGRGTACSEISSAIDTETSGILSIPSTLGGRPVKTIGQNAFAACGAITEVVIPEGVTTIAEGAFAETKLSRVILPESLQTIQAYALPVSAIYFKGKPPRQVDASAFATQEDGLTLQSAALAKSVVDVPKGYYSMQYATAWEKVLAAKNVWRGLEMAGDFSLLQAPGEEWYQEGLDYSYHDGAVYVTQENNRRLLLKIIDTAKRSFTIAADVDVPEQGTATLFAVCPNLTSIKVAAGHPYLIVNGGVLYDKTKGETELYPLAIPRAITSITIPRACKEVTPFAELIAGCANLRIVKVEPGHRVAVASGNILYLRHRATLFPLAIPPAVTTITLSRESSIPDIELFNQIVRRCPKLASIKVEQDHPSLFVSGGVLYEKYLETTFYPLVIPPAITLITLEKPGIILPAFRTLIPSCPKLLTIRIAKGCEDAVFQDGVLYQKVMDSLELLAVLPQAKTIKIAKTCTQIPKQMNSIRESVFSKCFNLQSIEVEEGNPAYISIDGVLYASDANLPVQLLAIPNKKTSLILPETVNSIVPNAYYGDAALKVYFMGLPPADFDGFARIIFRERILMEENVDATVYYPETSQEMWQEQLDSTGKWCGYLALQHSLPSFTYRHIGKTITITGVASYSRAKKLVLPNSIEGNPVTIIADNAFCDATWLRAIVIPDSVKRIGMNAFAGCVKLDVRKVRLPAALETLGRGAFTGCRGRSIALLPGEVELITRPGYRLATSAQGFTFNAKTGDGKATFTKPGMYDVVLFDAEGNLEVLRYDVGSAPTVSILKQNGDDWCQVYGAGAYWVNKEVTVRVTVPKYALFEGWFDEDGVCLSTTNNYTFTMGGENRNLIARFSTEDVEVQYELPTFVTVGQDFCMNVNFGRPVSAFKSIRAKLLPPGLTLTLENEQYKVCGVLKQAGTFKIAITAITHKGTTVSRTEPITVHPESFFLQPVLRPAVEHVVGWNGSLELLLATMTGVKSVFATRLPPGLKLVFRDGQYFIEGTPTKSGTYNVAVTFRTAAGTIRTRTVPIDVQVIPERHTGDVTSSLHYYHKDLGTLVEGWGDLKVDTMGRVFGLVSFEDGAVADFDATGKVVTSNNQMTVLEVAFNFYDTKGKCSKEKMMIYLAEYGYGYDVIEP